MDTLIQDLRFAVRTMLKAPGFTAVAILTLALGIGVNTAIFNIVNAVLLRPLPFEHPRQLVAIKADLPGLGLKDIGLAVNELDDLAQRSGVFDQISAVWAVDANLTGGPKPERILLAAVSPNYFTLLGGNAELGRVLGAQDTALGFAEPVVLSDAAWHRIFGGDRDILGKKVRLDNDLYTVVGVMPPSFRNPAAASVGDVDIWGTAGFRANPFPSPPQRRARFLPAAIGRIKPELTPQQAAAKLAAFAASLRQEYPGDYPAKARWDLRLQPLQDEVVGNVKPMMALLLGAVALILLIGCANVANLLLARASARQKEIAIRLAIGAQRSRLIRQLLTEAMLLAMTGGLLGVLAAGWTQAAVLRFVPTRLPRLSEVHMDWRVLAYAAVVSLLTGIVFGLAPAFQAARADMLGNLKEGSRGGTANVRQSRVRAAFVVSEIALSLVLMAGAGLLLRTLWTLLSVDAGFDAHNVVTSRTWIPVPNDPTTDRYRTSDARARWASEVIRRLHEVSGVTAATITSALPLGHNTGRAPFQVEGRPNEGDAATAELIFVSPEFFSTFQVPLISGRAFTDSDQPGGQQVIVLDQNAAKHWFPNEDPLGKRMQFAQSGAAPLPNAPPPPVFVVVGVVGNVKYDSLDEDPTPHVYGSIFQRSGRSFGIVVRAVGDPTAVGVKMRDAVQTVDPDLPVFGVQSMQAGIDASVAERRFSAQLVGLFAGLALLLAGIGVYGVVAYSVAQRTHEIGVRIALGATRSHVLRLVLASGMRIAGIGIAIGIIVAAVASRLIRSLLFHVRAADPIVFLGTAALLAMVALVACCVPARRAMRVDPLISLRYE